MEIKGGPVMVRFLACYGPGKWRQDDGSVITWGVEAVNRIGDTCGWLDMFVVELEEEWTGPFHCLESTPRALEWLGASGWEPVKDWRQSDGLVEVTSLYLLDRPDVMHAEPIMQAVTSR
jgi:hypothetical protein